MVTMEKVFRWAGALGFWVKRFYDNQFYLHPSGKDALDKHAGLLAGVDVFLYFSQARQIGGQLHKNPVALYAADDSSHCFPRPELGGVFLPSA